MPYLRDRVIVLKKEPYREHDRRYFMYGREHGLLSAVARGAALPKSKQAGHLEPFSESEVMIAQGKAFDKLAVARLITFPRSVDQPLLASLFLMRNVCEMVMSLTMPGIADDRIFYLLQELITACTAVRPQDRGVLTLLHQLTILRLLGFLGFAPQTAKAGGSISRRSLSDLARLENVDAAVLEAVVAYVSALLAETPLLKKPESVLAV